jgi:hypothetical protein
LLLLALLLTSSHALAVAGPQITASVVAGGGGSLQGGSYTLSGTTGQADAGGNLANGAYSLSSGFWNAGFSNWSTFVPVIKK